MFGWSSDAASRDSRMKRCRNCSLSASCGVSSFSATLRPRRSVLGAVDHRHAAAADQGLDPVAGDLKARLVVRHRTASPSSCHPTGSPHHPQNWCCAARRPPQAVQNRGRRLRGRPGPAPRRRVRRRCRAPAPARAADRGSRPPLADRPRSGRRPGPAPPAEAPRAARRRRAVAPAVPPAARGRRGRSGAGLVGPAALPVAGDCGGVTGATGASARRPVPGGTAAGTAGTAGCPAAAPPAAAAPRPTAVLPSRRRRPAGAATGPGGRRPPEVGRPGVGPAAAPGTGAAAGAGPAARPRRRAARRRPAAPPARASSCRPTSLSAAAEARRRSRRRCPWAVIAGAPCSRRRTLLGDGEVPAREEVPREQLERLGEAGHRRGVATVLEQVHRRFEAGVDRSAVRADPRLGQDRQHRVDRHQRRCGAARGGRRRQQADDLSPLGQHRAARHALIQRRRQLGGVADVLGVEAGRLQRSCRPRWPGAG